MTYVLLRVIDPFLWITTRQRIAHLVAFAQVERSSATDMQLAARLTPSAERAALYLRHGRDELRHAKLFLDQARKLAASIHAPPPLAPRSDCEGLFEKLGEATFLAFVHRAERRGRRQFEAHAKTLDLLGADELSDMFEAVLKDERHHEHYSAHLLHSISAGTPTTAQEQLRKVQRWELWRSFRRTGRRASRALYTLMMWVVYLLCWPLTKLLPKPSAPRLSPPEVP